MVIPLLTSEDRSSMERYGVSASTVRDVLVTVLTWPDGGPSRKQVSARLNLSSATVSKAVTYLIDNSYVIVDSEKQVGRPGRRESPLTINKGRCYLAGVSIREPRKGRDHGSLCGVVINLDGEIVETSTAVFDGSAPREVVVAVSGLIDRLVEPFRDKTAGVGVVLGGQIVADEGVVRHSWNFDPPWEDVLLAKRLYEVVGLDVEIENDANALALYEQWFGLGRSHDNFVVVRLTADGGGFGVVAHGMLLHGENGVSGELGHAEIDSSPGAETCRCQKRGCLELFIRSAEDGLRSRQTRSSILERIRLAGDALGRVLGQLQLTSASSCFIVCGEGIAHEPSFREAVVAAFDRRPFVGSARRLIEWQHASEEQVAQGAAAILLRHLPFAMHPRLGR